jgi:hypothetical protein
MAHGFNFGRIQKVHPLIVRDSILPAGGSESPWAVLQRLTCELGLGLGAAWLVPAEVEPMGLLKAKSSRVLYLSLRGETAQEIMDV